MVYLLALTSIAPFYIENVNYLFYKTSYLNEEVNCTELSPQLVFPALGML